MRVKVHSSLGNPLALAPCNKRSSNWWRCASVNLGGGPGSGLGAKASSPPCRQAFRHCDTELTEACTRRATSRKLQPCWRSATARQRRRANVLGDPTGLIPHKILPFCYLRNIQCRYKVYRERMDTAQKLYLEGVSIEAIAQRLETDTATIEGWIARPAPRKRRAVANV
jgi:hypothetical protein